MKNQILYKFVIPIIAIMLIACQFHKKNGITVRIENSSNFELTNVKVYTIDKKALIKFDTILSDQKVKNFLDMNEINKSDGAYTLEFFKNNKLEKFTGGYYTNGGSLNRTIILQLKMIRCWWICNLLKCRTCKLKF